MNYSNNRDNNQYYKYNKHDKLKSINTTNVEKYNKNTNKNSDEDYKTDSKKYYKYMINADNTQLHYRATYTLIINQIMISDTDYTNIVYFPWYKKRYHKYSKGILILNAQIIIGGPFIDILIIDGTGTILSNKTTISVSGTHVMHIRNPNQDTHLIVQVKNTFASDSNFPNIFGINLEFDVNY